MCSVETETQGFPPKEGTAGRQMTDGEGEKFLSTHIPWETTQRESEFLSKNCFLSLTALFLKLWIRMQPKSKFEIERWVVVAKLLD